MKFQLFTIISTAFKERLSCLLRHGLAPEPLALTICIGVAVGTLPLLWGTTLICIALAARLRLNQAALQAVNYLLYPVQLALIVPFYRMGESCFPFGPHLPKDLLRQALHREVGSNAALLGWSTFKAVGAWGITVIPLVLISHPLLRALLRKRAKRPPVPAS